MFNLAEDQIRLYEQEDTKKFSTFRGSAVCGPHSQYFVIDTAEQEIVAGVHFKPGGAYPFLKIPSLEFHNAHVELGDVWGGLAGEVRERLLAARTPEEKLRVLEMALWAAAKGDFVRHPAVGYALKEFRGAPETRTIADVTGRIGLSARRFIEVFEREVGLTPKLFCRVRRFQMVMQIIQRSRELDWAQVALDCGYYGRTSFMTSGPSRGLTPRLIWL